MLIYVQDKLLRPLLVAIMALMMLSFAPSVSASPFGQGVFGANVPFGSVTSLAIALGGNVNFTLTSDGTNFDGSASQTITVTSTDVVGYSLYTYATNPDMLSSGGNAINASSNVTAGPLGGNSWGYNIDGSSNYVGLTTTPVLFKSASGPYGSGDNTTVTYGVHTGLARPNGDYAVSVIYTAVAQNE